MSPFFSIIIPTYNRGAMMRRVFDSCVRQDFSDFEMIVIDDASTDDTIARIVEYGDPRITVVRATVNGGPSRARNLGVAAARGAWFVMLDSDFELLPGALARLAERCRAASPSVGNVASMCRWDVGPDTPFPPPAGTTEFGYGEFLAFVQTLTISEWFNCVRREVFADIHYPDARTSEAVFHLALAKRWRISLSTDRAVLIHTDAANRVSAPPPGLALEWMRRDASALATQAEAILAEHGDALARYAPRSLAMHKEAAVYWRLVSGERRKALEGLRGLELRRVSMKRLILLAVGMVSPSGLAVAQSYLSYLKKLANERFRKSATSPGSS